MHAFALVLAAMVGHEWARGVVTQAQRVVTHIRASHQPMAHMRKSAKECGVQGGGLRTSNKTRFTSVLECLLSVLRNEAPLRSLLQLGILTSAEVKATLQSADFWRRLAFLCRLLQPIAEVVMAIQRRSATLSDVTRFFCYLGRMLLELELDFPDGGCAAWTNHAFAHAAYHLHGQLSRTPAHAEAFKAHCAAAYNRRVREMNIPLARLALFLDPRYKLAANPSTDLGTLLTTVRAQLYA